MYTTQAIGNYRATWGEGVIWCNDYLYYVDIEGHNIIRFNPETNEEKIWNVNQRVGTVVAREKGNLVFAGDHGFFLLDEITGKITAILDPEPDKKDNRFNDGKCSPDGYFFAGTISLTKKEGDAKLYRLAPDLTVTEAFSPVTNSNGISWSRDSKTLYYIDTPRREVLAFDYSQGILSNEHSVISTAHINASPDGMTIDENDRLWIAFCHGACVACFDPTNGKEIQRIEIPCLETTACAFGGKNLDELYITTGIHKSVIEENAGRLFVIKNLGVKGQPSHKFAG
jgi:sugar lactone lactonase YvrE